MNDIYNMMDNQNRFMLCYEQDGCIKSENALKMGTRLFF